MLCVRSQGPQNGSADGKDLNWILLGNKPEGFPEDLKTD